MASPFKLGGFVVDWEKHIFVAVHKATGVETLMHNPWIFYDGVVGMRNGPINDYRIEIRDRSECELLLSGNLPSRDDFYDDLFPDVDYLVENGPMGGLP